MTAVGVGTTTIIVASADSQIRDICAVTVSRSSGGGGGSSSSNTTTETVKHNDGSTTTTVTDKKTGTVTETTKEKDGTVTTVETKKDGTATTVETKKDGTATETVKTPAGVTGTVVTNQDGRVTEARAAVSAAAVKEAAKEARPVELPVAVSPVKDAGEAPEIGVTLPKGAGPVQVRVPVENAAPGTVAVLVRPDGTETVVPTSVVTEEGLVLTLEEGAALKIVDNSKDFVDVSKDYWAAGAVDYVSARGLFNGTGPDTFTPAAPATRAQLMTVLARLDGADTSGAALEKGMAWAVEKGISDGANPAGTITRQQLAAMLWRYAGSPEPREAALDGFTDGGRVADYAGQAMGWAVEQGILTGTAEGALDPEGQATRAHVAAMLMRFNQAML